MIISALLVTTFFAVGLVVPCLAEEDLADRARRIHQAAIVVDTHVDVPEKLRKGRTKGSRRELLEILCQSGRSFRLSVFRTAINGKK